MRLHKIPADPRARFEAVAVTLFGRRYKQPMAQACGVSRETIRHWMTNPPADLDRYLIDALDAEIARGAEIKELRAQIAAARAS